MYWAIIVDDKVVNTTVWDGEGEWAPSDGFAVQAPDGVGIGWGYHGGVFSPPESNSPPDHDYEFNIRMDALSAQLKVDVEQFNLAYLSAIVVDGPSEDGKISKIRTDLAARKQKYKDDVDALMSEYED